MKTQTRFLFLSILLTLATSAFATTTLPLSIVETFHEERINGEFVWVLEDETGDFTFEEIQEWYQKGEKGKKEDYFAFGLKQSTYWVGFTVKNKSEKERELLVELINSYLNNFEFHRIDSKGNIYSDTLLPTDGFGKRSQFVNHDGRVHQNYHFSFALEKGEETTCFLRINPGKHTLRFRLLLWDMPYRFTKHNDYEITILHGFFILCFVFLLILGFAIYIIEFSFYWYYLIYVALGALFVFTDIGLAYRYWWPGFSGLQQVAAPVIVNLYLIAGVLFVRSYFKTPKHYYRTDIALKVAIVVAALIIPCALITPWIEQLNYAHFLFKISNLLYITTVGLFFLLLFRAVFRSKMYFSGLFLFGFSLHGLSVITANLQSVQILPGGSLATLLSGIGYPLTFNTHITLMLGMIIEMIVIFYIGIRRFAHIFKRSNEAIKDLATQKEKNRNLLVMGIETERERIARDLHDDLSRLTMVKMKLNSIKEQISQQDISKELDEVIKDVDDSHSELRGIARNLMPKALYELGLIAAVEELVYRIKILDENIDIHFYTNMSFEGSSRLTQLYLFRIVQELLNNMVKYSKASEASLQFVHHEAEQKMTLTMEDDGVGFDHSSALEKGNGLKNIIYRVDVLNGTLHIESKPGKGTLVSAEIPL